MRNCWLWFVRGSLESVNEIGYDLCRRVIPSKCVRSTESGLSPPGGWVDRRDRWIGWCHLIKEAGDDDLTDDDEEPRRSSMIEDKRERGKRMLTGGKKASK